MLQTNMDITVLREGQRRNKMIKLEETIKMRAKDEAEAQEIINQYRAHNNVKKAAYEKKEKKSKGEIIGEGYLVTITITHANFWCLEEN